MLKRRTLLTSCLGAMLSVGTGRAFLETYDLKLDVVHVAIRGIPTSFEGFKIAVMSDFHLYPFTRIDFLQLALDAASALKPDLVVLLGDFVDSTVEAVHELAPALGKMHSRLGVVAVLGNHDHRKGAAVVGEVLGTHGVTVLKNSGFSVPGPRGDLFVAGADSLAGQFDLDASLAARKRDAASILLVHEPDTADLVSRDGRVALQLSGHSHGGQVRLGGTERMLLPTGARKYPFGSYRVGNLFLHTNRGLGTTGLPLRLGSPPELTEVILTA